MKKLTLVLVSILVCQMAMAKNGLPFVGKRYFNFTGGNGAGQTIIIDKSGRVVIELHGKFGSAEVYRGKYQTLMCDEGECYQIIGKDKIALTDKKGNTMQCELPFFDLDSEQPCIVPLYKE